MRVPYRSVFAQLLQFVPHDAFNALVRQHRHEAHSKGFPSHTQFVAMLFMQLGQAHSLREIELGIGSIPDKFNHLGLADAPARSTLAYANEHRPWELYEDLFHLVLKSAQALALKGQSRGLRFKQKLFSIDATVIDLCAATFDWAKFRQTKRAAKLHLTLDQITKCCCTAASIRRPNSGSEPGKMKPHRETVAAMAPFRPVLDSSDMNSTELIRA